MNKLFWLMLGSVFIAGSPLLADSAPKNSFREELDAFLTNSTPLHPHTPHDFFDKMSLQIFATTAPPKSTIIRLNNESTPLLMKSIAGFCKGHNLLIPRIFLATDDQNIDMKFCTYDLKGSILLHKKTFEMFSTRVFKGYLQQTLLRMSKHFGHHKKLLDIRLAERIAAFAGIGLANFLWLLLTASRTSTTAKTLCCILQMALAGGSGALIYRMLTQRMSTHSFERVSSFHNDEQAREDIFPGKTPEESLLPVFDAPPEHALKVITDTQNFIIKRNAEYEQLRQWEEDEATEELVNN